MKKQMVVFGIYFNCLLTVAEMLWHMVPYNTLWNRIRRVKGFQCYDVELIATVPDLRGVELQFIGLDGQARYKVPWSDEFQTTRQVIEHYTPDLLEIYDKAHPDGKWNPVGRNGENGVDAEVERECMGLFNELYQKWMAEDGDFEQ